MRVVRVTVAATLLRGRPSRRREHGTAGSLPCMSRALTVCDTVVVGVEPDVVYAALSDVRQMGRWSPENTGAELAEPGAPIGVGTVFVGTNRRGRARWSTRCVVTAADPGRRFAFDVRAWGPGRRLLPVRVASWEYTFEPAVGGTLVTETWLDGRTGWPDWTASVFDRVATGRDSFATFQRGNIRRTLDRLKRELEWERARDQAPQDRTDDAS